MKTIQHILTAGALLAALASGQGQPIITNQPLTITNLAGTTANFLVGAEGTPPLAYQWWYGGIGFPVSPGGDTNASLSLTNVQAFNTAGSYWVVVTNSEGAVTSAVATLTVLTPPKIAVQPINQTASLFADATFRVWATGDSPLSYRWRLSAEDLADMTNATLTVTNIQRANAGEYDVVVTNFSGCVTSQIATLTITPFNSIYCFGFSWTGTSGLNPLGNSCGWTFPQYYQNRASNGPLWPEHLSTNLGLAYIGANNYAQCGAWSSDVRAQVTRFPIPRKPQLSLYYLWAGDGDFFRALPPDGGGHGYVPVTNEVAWNQIIEATVLNNSNAVAQLYAKGARVIVVSAGETPTNALTGLSPTTGWGALTPAEQAIENGYEARFHSRFYDAMRIFSQTRPDLRLIPVDIFSKLGTVAANPAQYGFTKVDIDALDDPALTDKSFTGAGADYMFWDSFHGTTKLHKLMTAWHLETLTNSILETLEVTTPAGSPVIQMNHLQIGRDYTLQSSADLAQWNDIQTFTAGAGTNRWTGGPGAASAAFYRLQWQP